MAIAEPQQTSRDEREIVGFSAQAESWWDPAGPFAPLHKLNPARLRILADIFSTHFGRPLEINAPFSDLTLIDVGCGGGLVTEPCARLGFSVSGLDPSPENIETARTHAEASGLTIDYRVGAPEQNVTDGQLYDVVVALEVIEHVSDINVFVDSLVETLKPGGLLVLSTINRTLKSLMLAKVVAEYVLNWVPKGTHQWRKFVRPSELTRALRANGMTVSDIRGMELDLATGDWQTSSDVSVNYILAATMD